MNTIASWLQEKSKDYEVGLKLYSESSAAQIRTLTLLQRGKSHRNMALLISALRKLRNLSERKANLTITKTPVKPKPVVIKKNVQEQMEKQALIHKSSESYFKKVRYGDLPKELRPRFKSLTDLWYQMCELKFALNEVPPKKQKQALEIILQIEALDQEKDLIWKEIDHWQEYKTILPLNTETDFKGLTPHELYLKKVNLGNYIHKKQKRIKKWLQAIEKEPIKPERLKIQQQINRTEKSIHEHELDIKKIESLL